MPHVRTLIFDPKRGTFHLVGFPDTNVMPRVDDLLMRTGVDAVADMRLNSLNLTLRYEYPMGDYAYIQAKGSVRCCRCDGWYVPNPESVKAWAESGRPFDPTDWECGGCDG